MAHNRSIFGIILAAALAAFPVSVAAQGQLGAGQIWGNPTVARAPAAPSNLTSFLTAGNGISKSGTTNVTLGINYSFAGTWLASQAFSAGLTGTTAAMSGGVSAASFTASGLTASRLVATDGSKVLISSISAADLASSVTGTTGSGSLVFGTSPTLTTPVISTIVNTGTLTLPTSTDTLVGRATTDTLTNKTISGASNTLSSIALSSLSSQADLTVVGNVSGGSAAPIALTATQLTTIPNTFTTALKGLVPPPTAVAGKVLSDDGTWITVSGTGTVTSVALALPAFITVSGSPVTGAGTLTGTLATQTANTIFAGPVSGGAAAPTFRAHVNADFPSGFVNCGTGLTGGALVGGGTCAADIASAAQFRAATASKLLDAATVYTAETTTTYGTTTTFDFDTFINTAVTLTGNITTQTLSNVRAGKAGTITFIQDGTGSRTSVWNSIFKFAGGTAPTLTTTASAIDVLSYHCRSATNCPAALIKDVR